MGSTICFLTFLFKWYQSMKEEGKQIHWHDEFICFVKIYGISNDKYFCFTFDVKKIMGQLRLIKWGQDKNFTFCY